MARADSTDARGRGIVGRIALYAVLFVAGITCIGAQLDYAVEDKPAFARLVFPPFEGLSHAVAAEQAIANEMKRAAVRESEALALARPTTSESFSRLARAYALNGDGERAQRAILASAARGWRDPLAQLVILQAAIQVEDWDVVAQRLTALRKMRRNHEFFDEKLVQLATVERGRTELAAQLAADPMGQRQFMRDGLTLLSPDIFADILVESAGQEGGENCDTFNLAAERLLRAGEREQALRVWLPVCRAENGAAMRDLSFHGEAQSGPNNPFAWRYPRSSGLSNFATSAGGERQVLQYANNSRLRKVVAERFVILDRGRHVVKIETAKSNRPVTGRRSEIQPSVQCLGENRQVLTMQDPGGEPSIVIPDRDCEVQLLQLLATPGRQTLSDVRIEN